MRLQKVAWGVLEVSPYPQSLAGLPVGSLKNPPAGFLQLVEDLANHEVAGKYDYLVSRDWNASENLAIIYAFIRNGAPVLKAVQEVFEKDLPSIQSFIEGWLVGREKRSRH